MLEIEQRLRDPGHEFTIEELTEAVNQLYEHGRIETRDDFHNTFFYEILPLFLIAEHVANGMAKIVFKGKDHPYDGEIIFGDPQQRQKVELTAAIDGHQEALLTELLARNGCAPAFQRIEASGKKKNRIFHDDKNVCEAIGWREYEQKTLRPLLEERLKQKIRKAKKNPHYGGAWLGIVFDDWIISLGEKKKRLDPVCERVLDCAQLCPFSRVFFVGFSGKYLTSSP